MSKPQPPKEIYVVVCPEGVVRAASTSLVLASDSVFLSGDAVHRYVLATEPPPAAHKAKPDDRPRKCPACNKRAMCNQRCAACNFGWALGTSKPKRKPAKRKKTK